MYSGVGDLQCENPSIFIHGTRLTPYLARLPFSLHLALAQDTSGLSSRQSGLGIPEIWTVVCCEHRAYGVPGEWLKTGGKSVKFLVNQLKFGNHDSYKNFLIQVLSPFKGISSLQ